MADEQPELSEAEVLERFVDISSELQMDNPIPWPTDPLSYLAEQGDAELYDQAAPAPNPGIQDSPGARDLRAFLAANPQYEVVYVGPMDGVPAGLLDAALPRVPALLRMLGFVARHGDLLVLAAAIGGGFLLGRLT